MTKTPDPDRKDFPHVGTTNISIFDRDTLSTKLRIGLDIKCSSDSNGTPRDSLICSVSKFPCLSQSLIHVILFSGIV